MPIVFARVDDRLSDGRMVQAWLPQLDVDEVVIPCTRQIRKNLNEGLLRLSLPYEYDLSLLESAKIPAYVTQP
ncbi:MAG: PTS sugar transporter subunit IIB, partial [Elusimicrobiaceae bacterium]|nr:PTS sugar transporter subunit IIB [Elusimicrobiaceae bacterium]